jgi:hypothetical protein
MSTDYTSISDHDLTLAIPGEIGSVRLRLIDAIQKLGYKVMGEQPLYAKRGSQCAAKWDCSLNALDYSTTLTVSLRQTNEASVLATFSFEVKSYMHMTRGDRQTLAREAEAIAALATERLALSACRSCGTQITDESHFCRRCGAPLDLDVPELEVLRLTKSVRGSYHYIFVGIVSSFLSFLAAFIVFVANGWRLNGLLFWIAIPLLNYGLFLLLQGMWQLHRTLNRDTRKSLTTPVQPAFKSSITTALPPARGNLSVTEATTNLLSKEPIPRKDRNTSEIDTDHLM